MSIPLVQLPTVFQRPFQRGSDAFQRLPTGASNGVPTPFQRGSNHPPYGFPKGKPTPHTRVRA